MELARALVLVGLAIAAAGAVLWGVSAAFPNFRVGRLPGDINIQGDNYRVMIPLGTMILASIVLTLILWIYTAFRR